MPVSLPDLAATEKLAAHLSGLLRTGDMVALEGPLGAGKTTLARALLQVLGVKGEVPSPTFTLVQTYDLPQFPIYHFDLYRLKSADELDELGWDDIADGVALIEWPDRAAGRMPADYLMLHLGMDDRGQRYCQPEPHGNWSQRWKDVP